MSQAFTHYLRVRYAECDAQQVVFNAKYAEYADIAATEFMRHVWGDYQALLNQGIDNQVVSLTINWQAPARFDDVLAIKVAVGHIGNTSYSLEMQLSRYPDGQAIAEAKVTYVFVSAESYTKTSIPSALRAQLQRGAPGQITNHAGIEL